MSIWGQIRPLIVELVQKSTGITTVWRDRERPFVEDTSQTIVLLHVISNRQIHEDFRYTYNAESNKLDITQCQTNAFVVSVFVHSYDEQDESQAVARLDRVRAFFNRRWEIGDQLRDLNVACFDVSDIRDLSDIENDRAVSKATLDLSFSYAVNLTHEFEGDGLDPHDWIQIVEDFQMAQPH